MSSQVFTKLLSKTVPPVPSTLGTGEYFTWLPCMKKIGKNHNHEQYLETLNVKFGPVFQDVAFNSLKIHISKTSACDCVKYSLVK